MTDYVPSPELVEACARGIGEERGTVDGATSWPWDLPAPLVDEYRMDALAALTAAVAYRTPEGHPELVPWVEVAALIEAARALADGLATAWANEGTFTAGDLLSQVVQERYNLRAALAPWTQEPRDEQ